MISYFYRPYREIRDSYKLLHSILPKGPFTQAIFAAIFLLLMHAIKWIDLQMH